MVYFSKRAKEKKEAEKWVWKLLITNKDILKIIGKKLKEARNSKKYTQDFVAENIDVSTDLLRNIENGRNIGSIATLLNICNILDITPNELFYDVLKNKEKVLDDKLYKEFQELSLKDKELIQTLIMHIKKNSDKNK